MWHLELQVFGGGWDTGERRQGPVCATQELSQWKVLWVAVVIVTFLFQWCMGVLPACMCVFVGMCVLSHFSEIWSPFGSIPKWIMSTLWARAAPSPSSWGFPRSKSPETLWQTLKYHQCSQEQTHSPPCNWQAWEERTGLSSTSNCLTKGTFLPIGLWPSGPRRGPSNWTLVFWKQG